ncbi:unnamed protein product, partial [Ranitomeya imitator]
NRQARINGSKQTLEFKSQQWFGATVRSHKEKVVACAPLYHWRSVKEASERDPVGTCYVAVQNFSTYAEYSPCRNQNADPAGQGYCQAGFSLDFYKQTLLHRRYESRFQHQWGGQSLLERCLLHGTRTAHGQRPCANGDLAVGGPGSFYWQGQVFSTNVVEIFKGYSFRSIIRNLAGEKKTKVGDSAYDYSYRGYSVAVGEFTGDSEQELVAGIPRGEQNFGYKYAKEHLNKPDAFWKQFLWTDEVKIKLFGHNNKRLMDHHLFFQVTIIDSTEMTYIHNFTGDQMASYFGYTVAVSDVNSDGYVNTILQCLGRS